MPEWQKPLIEEKMKKNYRPITKMISPIMPKVIGGCLMALIFVAVAQAQSLFHDAPAATIKLKNPTQADRAGAIQKGAKLFAANCAACHGTDAMGTGNIPALAKGPAQTVSAGELFWFIGKGSPENGMPPSDLPSTQRWQVVSFLQSLKNKPAIAMPVSPAISPAMSPVMVTPTPTDTASPPPPPFTDYRYEKPGQIHHILVSDIPAPLPGALTITNGANVVARPANAWPKVPAGFVVQLYASHLNNPRLIRTAPNGDFFVAESKTGIIRAFRGISADGQAEKMETFATGLDQPFGIAFYPRGKNPKWIYVGATDQIVRYAYESGDLKARGPAEKISALPTTPRGHWTRDLQFSLDSKILYVAIGSASNVDDPDVVPEEKNRARILSMNPAGTDQKVYASGIRNPAGLAINPTTGALWASVNERDGLGDNLVPDYITQVQPGGFYGWPWWYMGGKQDPRLIGKHPELKDKVVVPDVILQAHHASLEMMFYAGSSFPAKYTGDIFAAQHGSWNRSVRTGYELIRVPLHQTAKASGEYEDFMTGFVVDAGHVWGRPVGVTEANDGSLLVTDDGSNSIWRVVYTGKK
jgi:glucose/arabinose dehydrogenase/mono/diheme cytochrome c family protein